MRRTLVRATSAAWYAGAAVVTLAMSATAAHAQQWHLEAQAGQIRAVSEVTQATADTVLVGARLDHPLGGLRISTGVPTGAASPLWGALGGWRRLAARPGAGVVLGLDLSGNGFLLHDRSPGSLAGPSPPESSSTTGYAAAGQLLPGVGYESPALRIHGRSGPSLYRSRLDADARNRSVWLSEVEATVTPHPSIALLPALRHFQASERGYAYGGVTGMAAHRTASVWASVGRWMDVQDAGVPWAIGGTVHLHSRLALNLSLRRDSIDPLYLRAPLRSWTVGLSLRVAGAGPLPPPLPAAYEDGRATIRLPVARSRTRPRIAGDFTDWRPRPMEREGDSWSFGVTLPPGVYHYAFVTEADDWFVPEQTPGRRDDGMGGHVAVLVVTR